MTLCAGQLGYVETQRVVLFTDGDPLTLDSGATSRKSRSPYETYGELAPDASNAVFICHALTGDAHAAGHQGDPNRRGWWDNMIGPGRPLDTDRFFVICPNMLGGCRGTTGPSSVDPATGKPYGLRFPHFRCRPGHVHRGLLAHSESSGWLAAVGGSLGGMQVLQWRSTTRRRSQRGHRCASARLTAQNIAFSAVAREAIMRDAHFAGGDYYATGNRPDRGSHSRG